MRDRFSIAAVFHGRLEITIDSNQGVSGIYISEIQAVSRYRSAKKEQDKFY